MNRKKQILSDQYLAGDYGLGSWLGSNVGNLAQTIGGAALIATGVGIPAGVGMMASGVGGFASDAVSSKLAKEEEEINTKNNNAMIGKSRLDSYSNPQMIPTFATGGHLPEGKATLKDAKEYIKLFPDEMKMGEEVEYEHTGNKKLAQRIAADHIKDHLKMTGGDPGYYTRLKEAGISDELNKMGYGGKLTSDKAKEILKDGSIRGKKLTDRQKRYFGYIAGGGTPKKQDGGKIDYTGFAEAFSKLSDAEKNKILKERNSQTIPMEIDTPRYIGGTVNTPMMRFNLFKGLAKVGGVSGSLLNGLSNIDDVKSIYENVKGSIDNKKADGGDLETWKQMTSQRKDLQERARLDYYNQRLDSALLGNKYDEYRKLKNNLPSLDERQKLADELMKSGNFTNSINPSGVLKDQIEDYKYLHDKLITRDVKGTISNDPYLYGLRNSFTNPVPEHITSSKDYVRKMNMQWNPTKGYSNYVEVQNKAYGGVMKEPYSISGGLTDSVSYNEVSPVTEYKTGGSHESNPLGGVPIGNKARVEEGEVRVDFPEGSYIFSNRF